MCDRNSLNSTLFRLDNASYTAYKEIKGNYRFDNFTLIIDYVLIDEDTSATNFTIRDRKNASSNC